MVCELLAPAGSVEAFRAAVENGADAVYLSGKAFGARAYAPNFSDEELTEAVRYAHLRNVKVYVTVNTLVDDSEMRLLQEYLRFLYECEIDAVLVQDLGVAAVARACVPQLPLHASTQMTVHNAAGVRFLRDLGFTRVVVSREMSLPELQQCVQEGGAEIESFVHGALCISYSGQCLMSSLIGGRSGNRGRCAQPCRLNYRLETEEGQTVQEVGEYLLSPKDLNTLEMVPQLLAAGIHSLKIEGRMKRPEYVAVVVAAYRQALDAALHGEPLSLEPLQRDLEQIFNRDFTTAYLQERPGRTMMSDRRPNNRGLRAGRIVAYDYAKREGCLKLEQPLRQGDILDIWVKVGGRVNLTMQEMYVSGKLVEEAEPGTLVTIPNMPPVGMNDRAFKVFDAQLMLKARTSFAKEQRKVSVTAVVEAALGEPMRLTLRDGEGHEGIGETDFLAEEARKHALQIDSVRKQVDRLGTTPFILDKLEFKAQGELMVPVSEQNEMRRRAVEALEEARLAGYKRPALPVRACTLTLKAERSIAKEQWPEKICVQCSELAQVEAALAGGASCILFGGEDFVKPAPGPEEYAAVCQVVKKAGKELWLGTPRIVREWQLPRWEQVFSFAASQGASGVYLANLGLLELCREKTPTLAFWADAPLSHFNSQALAFWAEQGAVGATLSPELTFEQIRKLHWPEMLAGECLVHGRLTMMVSEFCPLGSYIGELHTGTCSQPCRQKEAYYLRDRKEERFPIFTDSSCRSYIFNAKELDLRGNLTQFRQTGVSQLRLDGRLYRPEALQRLTADYCRELLALQQGRVVPPPAVKPGATRGHYFRGVMMHDQ